MLHKISKIVLQFIFSNPIPHNDTRIKASKASNFNEARKWLLIAFCLENPLPQIAILEGMTSIFWPRFHEKWPFGVPLTDTPTKLPCLIQWFVFSFKPQNSYKTLPTLLYLHGFQPMFNNFLNSNSTISNSLVLIRNASPTQIQFHRLDGPQGWSWPH